MNHQIKRAVSGMAVIQEKQLIEWSRIDCWREANNRVGDSRASFVALVLLQRHWFRCYLASGPKLPLLLLELSTFQVATEIDD